MSFNVIASVTVHSDFGAQENKICHRFHFSPFYLPWNDETGWQHLIFFECWVLSQLFHSLLSPSSRLFSSSSLSAIRVVSSAYLRLLIFHPAILIPDCDSSILAFHMMYPGYKLNKQCENIQPWHTPFSILNQSVVPCLIWPVLWPLLTLQNLLA